MSKKYTEESKERETCRALPVKPAPPSFPEKIVLAKAARQRPPHERLVWDDEDKYSSAALGEIRFFVVDESRAHSKPTWEGTVMEHDGDRLGGLICAPDREAAKAAVVAMYDEWRRARNKEWEEVMGR